MGNLTELGTEQFLTEREWTVDDIPVLSARIALPQPVSDADRASRRIRRYYRAQLWAYLRYCERFLLPQAAAALHAALAEGGALPEFRAELTYRVTCNEGGMWSLYTQSRETLGAETLVTRRGDTWDLTIGYPAPLGAFFPPRTAWKRRLLTLAAAEAERRQRAGSACWRRSWRRALRRHFNSRNYYLTPEGLVFFYPTYALAPPSEGIPTFFVPYGRERFTCLAGPEKPGGGQGKKQEKL